MNYTPRVPLRFGELAAGHGLMIGCAACRRGSAFSRAELLQKFGEEGRVADVLKRFRCSNCRAKRPGRPPPDVRVDVVRMKVAIGNARTEGERAREKLEPVDRLMWDIERLKPPPIG